MKVLVLGSSGMIGSTMLRILAEDPTLQVTGTVRRNDVGRLPEATGCRTWIAGIDLLNPDHLSSVLRQSQPDVVVNCAGLTKHLPVGNDPIPSLTTNALLPHRLAELC